MGIFSHVGHLVGSLTGSTQADAAHDAARAQEEYLRQAIAEFRNSYTGQQALWNPFVNAGTQGLSNLNALNSGDYSGFSNSPDYLYARGQALDAVDSRAGALGNLFSGARATALEQRGNDLATQNLGNYRNALNQQIGYGLSGTAGLSGALSDTTHGIADSLTGIGNARAGGAIGAGNAYGNALGNLINLGTSVFSGGMGGGFGGGSSIFGGMSSRPSVVTSNTGYNPYYPQR